MINIPLQAIPNQTLSVVLNSLLFDITLKATNGIMSATIAINGVEIISSVRLVAGTPILPYQYLEQGNFILLTSNDDLPDYTLFGINQTLIYASEAEIEVIRGV